MCGPKRVWFSSRFGLKYYRVWFVHFGESGQQRLKETIKFSVLVIMHLLGSAI